jgi:hypothetical protein
VAPQCDQSACLREVNRCISQVNEREIARALDHFNVSEREKQEVLAAIVVRKDEVVNLSP